MVSKYIRLLRPIAWITFFLPFSVGFGLGVNQNSNPIHMIFAFLAFVFWMGFCFILNALSDRNVDKYHDGRSKDMNLIFQPLVTGEITIKTAISISIIFLLLSLIFGWLINVQFFLLILIVDIIGYIYSMPPLRLKSKPLGDIFCNAFAAVNIFSAGLSIGGENMNIFLVISIFLMAAVFYIPTVVTDYEFDKKAGLKTSAVFYGPKKILLSMYPLTILSIIFWLSVFISPKLELKVLSIICIIYLILFTLASNLKLKKDRLYLHEDWILIPFLFISLGFIIYGFFKFIM